MTAAANRRVHGPGGALATPPPSSLPVAAAAATGIQVGAAIVATRAVASTIDPISLTFLRYLIGACCLLPVALVATRQRIVRRDLLPVGLLGIVQFGLLIVLLQLGLQTVPAGTGSLIFATSPLWALLFGTVLGEERWSGPKAVGLMLALAGLAIVLRPNLPPVGPGGVAPGELLVLGAAVCAAVSSVGSRPYVRRYGALTVSATAMLATVAALAVPALATGVVAEVAGLTAGERIIVLALGVGSGIGYGLWLWALKSLTASTVTAFLMLSPVTALLAGVVLLDEPLTWPAVLGIVVVGGGLWLATGSRRRAPGQSARPGPAGVAGPG